MTSPSPRTTVVAGGTAGLGLGIARARLAAGDQVTVLGRDPVRGRRFLDDATANGAEGRAAFVAADLGTLRGTRDAVLAVADRHDVVDALAMTAYAPPLSRRITADGLESGVAVYGFARKMLADGLADRLDASEHPVILSLSGVGVVHGTIDWDDPTLEHRWSTVRSTTQAGRVAELVGVAHADRRPHVAYILAHPGFTRTAFSGTPRALLPLVQLLGLIAGRSVDQSLSPLLPLIEVPPAEALSAYDRGRVIDTARFADLDEAHRVDAWLDEVALRTP
jgi:NAD(P)-dependent dehydrogenase (short-subunit alcohol dehydrogenase family)